MFVNKTNRKAYIISYAYHFNITVKEAEAKVEKDPQVLEDYAEYLDNRGY